MFEEEKSKSKYPSEVDRLQKELEETKKNFLVIINDQADEIKKLKHPDQHFKQIMIDFGVAQVLKLHLISITFRSDLGPVYHEAIQYAIAKLERRENILDQPIPKTLEEKILYDKME